MQSRRAQIENCARSCCRSSSAPAVDAASDSFVEREAELTRRENELREREDALAQLLRLYDISDQRLTRIIKRNSQSRSTITKSSCGSTPDRRPESALRAQTPRLNHHVSDDFAPQILQRPRSARIGRKGSCGQSKYTECTVHTSSWLSPSPIHRTACAFDSSFLRSVKQNMSNFSQNQSTPPRSSISLNASENLFEKSLRVRRARECNTGRSPSSSMNAGGTEAEQRSSYLGSRSVSREKERPCSSHSARGMHRDVITYESIIHAAQGSVLGGKETRARPLIAKNGGGDPLSLQPRLNYQSTKLILNKNSIGLTRATGNLPFTSISKFEYVDNLYQKPKAVPPAAVAVNESTKAWLNTKLRDLQSLQNELATIRIK